MYEMKLWAAKDGDGRSNLYRSSRKPCKSAGGVYELSKSIVDHNHEVSKIACQGIGPGECREIKALDILKSTVEYVPGPTPLKEAWRDFKYSNFAWSRCPELTNLTDALTREFPDE